VLGRRVRDAVKVILPSDPSVLGGYAAYKESLFDESKLQLDPKSEPTRWQIRQLSDDQKDAVSVVLATAGRKGKKAAIQCSLQALENFAIQYPDGRTETIHVPQMEHTPIGTAIKDEWMVRMGFPTPIIDELFELIVFFSEVQLPLSMPSEPPSGETDKSSQESKD